MFKLFGILILSFLFTGILAVPFINLLYKLRFRLKRVNTVQRAHQRAGEKAHAEGAVTWSQLHSAKIGTPTGGGILVVIATFLFALIFYGVTQFTLNWTAVILFLTLFLFGLLGFYDDARKMVRLHGKKIRALPALPKFLLQFAAAGLVAYFLVTRMGLTTVDLPVVGPLWGWGPVELGWWYIPVAALVIIASSNAFNITDGLDGLATGLMLIALSAFWYLTGGSPFSGDLTLLIAVLMGSLLAFLYFNIFPARIFMGDTGALALGALLAVVALMTEQVLVLPIIAGVFVAETLSSLIQMASIRFRRGKKVFKIAPLHHHFEALGWDETKVTMRAWLLGVILAFVGLFVASFGVR